MRFVLIDRITRWEVGTSAEAIKNVALSEDFFDDHFPRRPVLPGVLMIEGLAQLSGLLLEFSLREKYAQALGAPVGDAKAVLTILERTKFRGLVQPGDSLLYRTQIVALNQSGGKVSAQAVREGRLVVTTGMVFAFRHVEDPLLEQKRQALMQVWTQPDGLGG